MEQDRSLIPLSRAARKLKRDALEDLARSREEDWISGPMKKFGIGLLVGFFAVLSIVLIFGYFSAENPNDSRESTELLET